MMINGKRDFFLVFDGSSWWDDDDSVIRLLRALSCGLRMERCAMLKEKRQCQSLSLWEMDGLLSL